MKIINVVGARPNFMKISPLVKEIKKNSEIESILVHTGQHYDNSMSGFFLNDLGLPKPDIYLNVGSGSHAVQTAEIMKGFEQVCVEYKPDLVIVVGDVNSTIACSLVASKMHIPVAHIEAGLRSRDKTMPEEINRILTDQVSDYLFTTCEEAGDNLRKEGIPRDKIHFVGNLMIDTLMEHIDTERSSGTLKRMGLEYGKYAVLTLHRPSNVDHKDVLSGILDAVCTISRKVPVLFPAHPRTVKQIKAFGYGEILRTCSENFVSTSPREGKDVILLEPLGYFDFLDISSNAKFIMTDSGGIQEESTILGVPCLTIRENTERPITISEGTNVLVGTDPGKIISAAEEVICGGILKNKAPEYWDGKAAQRIVRILCEKALKRGGR